MADLQRVELPRDRFGRPMVLPPGAKAKREAYRRTTTFVKALDDQFHLTRWKQRQTARGMGLRKDLQLAAFAADSEDKKALDDIAAKACEAALSSAAATTGTALHSLTERIDRGKPLGHVPTEYRGDIEAYQKANTGMEMVAIEQFRVYDKWKVAGTADRLVRHRGRLRIADVKTGSLDYAVQKISMQLAMYARSVAYDVATDKRTEPEPDLDLNQAVVIHLPAGQAKCDLYLIDIQKGWGACLLAKQVWDWRGEKGLTELIDDDYDGPAFNRTYLDLAMAATTLEELRDVWHAAKAGCAATPDFLAACQRRKAELAA